MPSPATITVDQVVLMIVILGLFGLIGFRRGGNREMWMLLGLAVAFVFVTQFLDNLTPLVNKIHRMVRFVLKGGVTSDDPVVIWGQVKNLPALISTDAHRRHLGAVVFSVLALGSYILSTLRASAAGGPSTRVVGMLLGAVNGFIIASYIFRYALSATSATIALESGALRQTLTSGQTIGKILILAVVGLIALGLYGASRGGRSS